MWSDLHRLLLARLQAAGEIDWSKAVVGDRGYDYDNHRRAVRERGIRPRIARKQTQHGSGLGRERWVVERTLSWLHQHRRLRIRWERRADFTKPSSVSPAP